jgi:hypothetical protein
LFFSVFSVQSFNRPFADAHSSTPRAQRDFLAAGQLYVFAVVSAFSVVKLSLRPSRLRGSNFIAVSDIGSCRLGGESFEVHVVKTSPESRSPLPFCEKVCYLCLFEANRGCLKQLIQIFQSVEALLGDAPTRRSYISTKKRGWDFAEKTVSGVKRGTSGLLAVREDPGIRT